MYPPRRTHGLVLAALLWALGSKPGHLVAQLPPDLPDVLIAESGETISEVKTWEEVRRLELLRMFQREMYGQLPAVPQDFGFELVESGDAFDGLATRKQYRLRFSSDPTAPTMDLLVYLPQQATAPVPVILGMNFWGNHAIANDAKILLSRSYVESRSNRWCDLSGVQHGRATDACRGTNSRQWPVETILRRGYALATFYRNDVDPDDADMFDDGIRKLFPQLQDRGDNFSTIGAWAWSISRAIDCLTQDDAINAERIAVFGWSRLGKAALWAAANDNRIAVTLSNEAGAGGAKLFRRNVGERIARLNTHFPHWYCQNFHRYNGHDTSLPFDMHMLVSMIAPRAVCLGGAVDDQHADPEGEFWSLKAAEAVYVDLYGLAGVPATNMLKPGERAFGHLGYHYRDGRHDVLESDWSAYLDFCDRHFQTQATTDTAD